MEAPIESGQRLGPYEILEQLGAGGMGEVWLGRDTRLGREVAIKILPPQFAVEQDRVERFEREARAAAALNHPHIAAVYDIGEHDAGIRFIVQEYLQGQSLKSALAPGALPLKRALKLGIEIAEALGAAHAAGIIHRDVKPDNVFVTPGGHAKVLDFGLAKLTEVALAPDQDPSMSPTIVGTMAGQVMGTAGYMSPEQIDGLPDIDHRADLFAFGSLLYEMASGRRAFAGRSVADTLARIQHEEPVSFSEIDAGLPAELQRIVSKLLRKDPDDRYQSAADLIVDLRALGAAVEAGAAPEAGAPPSRPTGAVGPLRPHGSAGTAHAWGGRFSLLAVIGAVIGALGFWAGTRISGPPPVDSRDELQFAIELPAEVVELPRGYGNNITVTPDGQTIMFIGMTADGSRRLYRRRIDAVGAERFGEMTNAQTPVLATDNEWLAVGVEQSRYSRVKLSGGEPFVLCDACLDGTWGDDGYFYFSRAGEIWRRQPDVSSEELVLEPVPDEGAGYLSRSAILPGSQAAVVEVGNYVRGGIVAMSFDGERVAPISPDGGSPIYSSSGHVLFPRGNSLFAVPLDPGTLEVNGPAEPVLTGVRVENGGAVQADLADNGTLVYLPAVDSPGTSLVLVDAAGEVERVYGARRIYTTPRFSPDGTRAAMIVNEEGRTDVWVLDCETDAMGQITTAETATSPAWSPDGTWIAFGAEKEDGFAIYRVDVSSQNVRELHESEYPLSPAGFLSDGAELLFIERSPRSDIFALQLGGDLEEPSIRPILETVEVEESAAISEDGRLLVYESERAGRRQIFVRDLVNNQEIQVSPRGGMEPIWAPGGRTVLFRDSGDWNVAAASVAVEPQLRLLGLEARFPSAPYWMGFIEPAYDTTPDGKLLMVRHREPAAPPDRIHVIVNFDRRLSR